MFGKPCKDEKQSTKEAPILLNRQEIFCPSGDYSSGMLHSLVFHRFLFWAPFLFLGINYLLCLLVPYGINQNAILAFKAMNGWH